jgi:hypothetical protein
MFYMQIGRKVMYVATLTPKLNPQVFKTVKDPGIKERRRFATNLRIAVRVKKFEKYCTKISVGNEKQNMFLLRRVTDDSDPDPLVRGINPRIRIRIHTKIHCH